MTTPILGRLEQVDLRRVWISESSGFTPWLAQPENLKLLGEAIGIDLELVAREKDVGPFRADILCRDMEREDALVLIENQLEATDHRHLGQLMTYAAGLKAVTIVWVAAEIREEHRAALDWLNSVTAEGINFFGLEIELWRIGDSPAAPKFNIISKPNDWSRRITEGFVSAAESSEKKQIQLEFWTAFHDYIRKRGSSLKLRRPLPRSARFVAVGHGGIRLGAVASFWDSVLESYAGHEVRAELILVGPFAKQNFAALEARKGEIESELGHPLTWLNPSETERSRIYARLPVNLNDRAKWPEYQRWLLDNLEALERVFMPRVRVLNLPGNAGEEADETS